MASNGKKSFPLRLDPKLYEIIERWAADELRSVNGHIEFLLRDAVYKAGRLPGNRAASPTSFSPQQASADSSMDDNKKDDEDK